MNVILFDGVCNFCNFWVNFLLKTDTYGKLTFASLQSEFGQEFLRKNNLNTGEFDSFIFVGEGYYKIKSRAAFEVAKLLPVPYKWLRIFSFLPAGITDFIYDLIAQNRYKLFGKKEACMIPTPEQRKRFK